MDRAYSGSGGRDSSGEASRTPGNNGRRNSGGRGRWDGPFMQRATAQASGSASWVEQGAVAYSGSPQTPPVGALLGRSPSGGRGSGRGGAMLRNNSSSSGDGRGAGSGRARYPPYWDALDLQEPMKKGHILRWGSALCSDGCTETLAAVVECVSGSQRAMCFQACSVGICGSLAADCASPHDSCITSTRLRRARLRVNATTRTDAWCSVEGLPTDILIKGETAQNRCTQQVLQQAENRAPAASSCTGAVCCLLSDHARMSQLPAQQTSRAAAWGAVVHACNTHTCVECRVALQGL